MLAEATHLIDRLRSGTLSDEELGESAVRLDVLLPDPNWYDYTIDHVPELTAEQVVRRAFLYRPIQL